MLEFNNKHKKIDLRNLIFSNNIHENILDDIYNSVTWITYDGYFPIVVIVLGGIAIFLSVKGLFSFFSGWEQANNKNITNDYNEAVVSIGDENVALDIDGYTSKSDESTTLKLADGTEVVVNSADANLYNSESYDAQNVDNSISSNNDDLYYNVDENGLNRALVQLGDQTIILEISDYTRCSETEVELELTDGTKLTVNSADLILFNSQSSIMNQVQEEDLGETRSLTR